jgi:hypothetical protein
MGEKKIKMIFELFIKVLEVLCSFHPLTSPGCVPQLRSARAPQSKA